MEILLVKEKNGYVEMPAKEVVRYKGLSIEKEKISPYKWIPLENGAEVFLKNRTGRVFLRTRELTVGDENADVVIPNSDIRAVISENTITFYKMDEQREPYIFVNGKEIAFTQNSLCMEYGESDIVMFRDVECTLWKDRIELNGEDGSFYTHLVELNATEPLTKESIHYRRSPRLVMNAPEESVVINSPPEKAHFSKQGIVQMIVPPLVMMALTIATSLLSSGGAYVIVTAAMTGMTTVFSIIQYFNEKKDCKEKNKKRKEFYENYLLDKRKELSWLYNREKAAYHYNYPELSEIEEMIRTFNSRLYEKNYNDDDFLQIRIGTCDAAASYQIEFDAPEMVMDEDELVKEAGALVEEFSIIQDKPVVIDLKKAHLGLVGEKNLIHEQIKLYIAQLTFFHSYHDLQIINIYDKKYNDDFAWMNWFPHLKIQSINVNGNINSERMRDQILGSLQQILKERQIKNEEKKKESRYVPHFLFIIDEPKLIIEHAIMEFLGKSDFTLGFSILYTTYLRSNLPENIGTVLLLEDSEHGTLLMEEKKVIDRKIKLQNCGNVKLEWMARNVCALKHEKGMTSHIPNSITFFDMYGIKRPEELQIAKRWKENQAYRTLAVPLGVRAVDDYVYLNLHEKAHGPHGLVAGTTGSGKSEIIQSYILSLVVNFHPYEVGFLLIDYKGGGMAGLFKDMPHLLGTITNLDGSESQRAMASIKSELARRQRIFSNHNVNHIDSYNKLFKNGEAKEPIPHLFLISDEFAELKKEQPDFMAELVSTARIGRSLGVHLILATQKPSGVVDDQIWTNSKFKLALKVQDEADSREILKTADAAGITQPGRAYLQVGNNEVYELFQSAWSGAAYSRDGEKEETDMRVYRLNELGQGELLNMDLSSADEDTSVKATQLDVTIQYVKKTFEQEGVPSVKKPWLPPLKTMLVSPHVEKIADITEKKKPDLQIALGMVDIPEEQAQEELVIDLMKEGHIAYFASAGYGKSTMLMTAVLSLAIKNDVELVNFYIIDLGNSALIPLSNLPHTADYMQFDDTVKIGKLIRILQEEMNTRKKLFAEKMAQNFDVYNQTADVPLKAIVVVVDNFDVVTEIGYDEEEFFTRLSRDGSGLGIYLIITATQSGAVRFATLNNFKVKIAGFMFDESEASSIVGRSDYKLPEIQGRALVSYHNVNIMQIYTMANLSDEVGYITEIKNLIQRLTENCGGKCAPKIPMLPDQFTSDMLADYDNAGLEAVLGLEKEKVEVRGLNRAMSPFIIIGEPAKGKTNVLNIILDQIMEKAVIYLVDSKKLSFYSYNEKTEYYQPGGDIEDLMDELNEFAEDRNAQFKAALEKGAAIPPKEFYLQQEPYYLLVDDADDFIEMLEDDADEYAEIIKRAVECGLIFIVNISTSGLRGYDDLTSWIKTAVYGLVLSDQGMNSIFPVAYDRENPVFGDGLLFKNGAYERIRIPQCID